MALSITSGYTFVAGGTVTAGNLNDLVDVAAMTGVDRGHVNTSDGFFITRGSAPPSGQDTLEPWSDSAVDHVFALVGTDARVSSLPLATTVTAATIVLLGDVVTPASSGVFGEVEGQKPEPGGEIVIGAATHEGAAGDTTVLDGSSVVLMELGATTTAGDQMFMVTNKITPAPAGTIGAKVFGMALENGDSGDLKWISLWR